MITLERGQEIKISQRHDYNLLPWKQNIFITALRMRTSEIVRLKY